MKNYFFLILGIYGIIAQAQTYSFLDVNQVKARVNSGGDLHWDPFNSQFNGYQCPIGSNNNWSGPTSLWIGGIDSGNQLKLAAQTYQQSGVDFWPGPLTQVTASISSTTMNQYNRVWKLNQIDIDNFILNYSNGNVQNGSYVPVVDLLTWPGNGDISQNQSSILAPFMDVNGDGVYDPLGAGDYPLIKGDQAIYTIYNDNYSIHQSSGGNSIGVEIHLMAYAYGNSNFTINNPFLNYTTFYNYKIINRTTTILDNTYSGLFNDTDLGYFQDDYVGCNKNNAYAYIYNNPSNLANEPAIGIVQLKGPFSDPGNSTDDNNNGLIDEPFEQIIMSNFMYFNNSFPGIPINQSDPNTANEYYQYLSSVWKDGSHLTCGGNGYGGTLTTNLAYSGNTYTNGPCGTLQWNETGNGSDKKIILSSGPYTLLPGAIHEMEFAFITSYDSLNNNPLSNLDTMVQGLRNFNNTATTNLKEKSIEYSFQIIPNPAHNYVKIKMSQAIKQSAKIEIIDLFNNSLISEYNTNFNNHEFDLSNLSPGIYFVKISSDNINIIKKFIKE